MPELIILSIIVVVIMFFALHKKEQLKRSQKNKHNLAVWLTHLVNQYNEAIDQFTYVLSSKIDLIKSYNDYVCAEKLTEIERQYEHTRGEASELITMINAPDFADYPICHVKEKCSQIEGLISDMQHFIDLINGLRPEPRDYSYSTYDTKDQREAEIPKARQTSASSTVSYFAGCDNKDAVTMRYKSLAKIYHPDNNNGDTDTFRLIQAEYKRLLAKY